METGVKAARRKEWLIREREGEGSDIKGGH